MKIFQLRLLPFASCVVHIATAGLLTVTTAAAPTDDGRVLTLTIRETRGIARANTAISSGVPFAKGRLKEEARLTVKGPNGRIVPSQFDVLARWDDGSVKWILVSTILSEVDPHGVFELAIFQKPSTEDAISRKKGAEIIRLAKSVRVRYPALSVEINSQGLPESVLVFDGNKGVKLVRGGSQLLLDNEVILPEQVQAVDIYVEDHGPIRTVIRTKGEIKLKNGKAFTYVARNKIFANGEISTSYSVINQQVEGFNSYGVLLSLADGFHQALINRQEIRLGNEAVGVRQTSRETAVFYGHRSSGRSVRQRYHGGMRLTGKAKSLGIAIDDFWQRYPSALSVTSGQARLWFYPEEEKPAPFYQVGRAARGDFTIMACPFTAANWSVAQLGATRLQAFAGPKWYYESQVLGQYAAYDVELTNGSYHAYLDKLLAFLRRRKFLFNEFGYWNFGDERGSADSNFWRNNEFGIAFAMLFHYMRSGDLQFYEEGISFARHFRDTDTLHFGSEKGKSIKHTDHHVAKGEYNVAHQWVEGILLDYLLTGDRRSLEVAREMAVHLVEYALEMSGRLKDKPTIIPMTERSLGWTLISLMFLEEVTGDKQYAEAIKMLVDGIVASQDEKRGHWPRSLRSPHPDYETGGAPFMVGVLTEALMRYHERTGDEAVARSLIKSSYWLSDEMWNPEQKNLRYKQMNGAWNDYNDGRTIPLVLPGMIYAQYLGRDDERYRNIVDQTLERYDGLCADLGKRGEDKFVDHTGDNGRSFKSLGMMSRSMPRFFYYYEKIRSSD